MSNRSNNKTFWRCDRCNLASHPDDVGYISVYSMCEDGDARFPPMTVFTVRQDPRSGDVIHETRPARFCSYNCMHEFKAAKPRDAGSDPVGADYGSQAGDGDDWRSYGSSPEEERWHRRHR